MSHIFFSILIMYRFFFQKMHNVDAAKSLLNFHFTVKDLGEARHFLGLQITFYKADSGKLLAVKISNENLSLVCWRALKR